MASLIGETVNYAIEFDTETSDANGNATGFPSPVLASGSFVVGNSQEVSVPVNYTFTGGGFPQTFSGTATINLNASTLSVGFSGTAQPFDLKFTLSNLAQGSVQAVTAAAQTGSSGVQGGVNAETSPTHTNTTVTTGFTFYGFEPNTTIAQTDQLTFGAGSPEISSATYDAATGQLVVSGSSFTTSSGDFDTTGLTLIGEDGSTHTLSNASTITGTPTSTSFKVDLSTADQLAVDGLLNKNGTASTGTDIYAASNGGSTTYSISGDTTFDTGATAGSGGVTVSNALTPSISSVFYNNQTGVLTLNGSGFENDGDYGGINLGQITLTGGANQTYTFNAQDFASVSSNTQATIDLSNVTATNTQTVMSGEEGSVNARFDRNGMTSAEGTAYNLAATVGWDSGAGAAIATQAVTVGTATNVSASITSESDSSPSGSDINTGKTVTFTLNFDNPVVVSGTPQLTLNGGQTANFLSGSASTALVFSYTVQNGINIADLQATAVNLNGGTITAAGANADLSSFATIDTHVQIDTTPPAVSSPNDTVAVNSGATAINIGAPTDAGTPNSANLTIKAGTLPTDGTVTLAGGTTLVVSNETLTSAQLQGLEFTPTPNASGTSSTFTYTVTDPAQNTSTGTATLAIAAAGATTVGGTTAGQQTTNEAPVLPFTGATITDPNNGTDTLTIQLTSGGSATGATGTLAESGGQPALASNGNGLYTLAAGSAAAVQAELQSLVFTPTMGAAGSSTTTGFTLTDTSSVGPTNSAPNTTTTVTDFDSPATLSAPTLAASSDTGVSNSDDVTNGTTPTFTGLAETGASVTLYDNGIAIGSGTAAGGSYNIATSGLGQGANSITATQTANGLTSAVSPATTVTLDTTAPTITAVADSGPGISNGSGDLTAGKTVALTVTASEAVYVQGGTPTLTLNDGGTATYTGGSGNTSLTFTTTVAAGQNTSALAVTAVNAKGATVTDAAGNPINPSLAGATTPTGTLVIDTTAPVASSPTLTVAQNSGATPIGIAAPSDNLTAAGGLAIVAGALPTDGTVTLADGATAVTAGESLTAAQLAGLDFTPIAGVSNQGSTFTYTVTDGAGNATTGTAALNVGSPGAPTITGTHATATMSEAAVTPFAGVTVADPSAATETLNIALTGPGGTLTGAGLTANSNGTYQLTGTAAGVTAELDALSLMPTAGAPGTTSTTTFVLTNASSAGTSVTDAGTSVTDTDPAAPPPPPAPSSPDAVSIDPSVTYKNGVFTLTGTASSASGVSSVEISADVDGTRQDLGAATVNANGTFAFSDMVSDQQTFFVATLTDGAGGQAMSADPGFNLKGGLGPTGGIGKAEDFDATGHVSTTLYRLNGSRLVGIDAPGQTVDLQPFDIVDNHHEAGTNFVFNRGDGLDVIDGFRLAGPGHDTIDLPSSDFTNLANVLRHTGDVQGSAFITDPKTGDAIRLAGVSTAELKAHPKDITFHG